VRIIFGILLALSPSLTDFFGVQGLIAVLIIANAAGVIYGIYVAEKDFHVMFGVKSLARIYIVAAVASVLPFLLVRTAPWPLLFRIVGGGLLCIFLYLTLIPSTGLLNEPELKTLSGITQRIRPLAPIIKPLLKYEKKIMRARAY